MWGLEVVGPERVQEAYRAYNVLILAVDYNHEFVSLFQNFSVQPAEIFQLDLHYERDDTATFFQSVRPRLELIYDRMADQESKDTYETMLRYRVNRNAEYLPRITLPAYFPDKLGNASFLGSEEVFVDAGAYTGDTVNGFIKAVSGQYRSIFALEPNPQNYEELQRSASQLQNVVCYKMGVGEAPAEVKFILEGSRSKAADEGNQVIQVDTLDHLLHDTPVTYIKMDIEGMECPALRGAEHIIKTYRPKLAVCTYHSNEDMVRVPELILRFNSDYQLYLRQHTPSVVDTVCYAI